MVWVSHTAEVGTICQLEDVEQEEVEGEEEGAGMATVEVMEDGETGEVMEGEMEGEMEETGEIFHYLPCPTPSAFCRHFDDE